LVSGARNDSNDLVWKSKGLIELFRGRNHLVEDFPRILRLGQNKLLDL
jgi:hypothetical protein